MIVDGGGEFRAELVQYLENLGIYVHVTDAMAPHQNGKTERAGASLKGQLEKAQEKFAPQSDAEQEMLMDECVLARNRYHNRSGYTAHQRVFGMSLRMPRSLCSDDVYDAETLALDSKCGFQRSHEARVAQ